MKPAAPTSGTRRFSWNLNEAGLFAKNAGDLDVALDYLNASVQDDRDPENARSLAISLQNLTDCLGRLGHTQAAVAAAEEALTHATTTADRKQIGYAHAFRAWVADLAGDTRAADQHFLTADHTQHTDDPNGNHLYSLDGVWWAGWLARTGRPDPARRLTTRNLTLSRDHGWGANAAKCQVILARLDLTDRDFDRAGEHLAAAIRTFRDGDYLVDLADALTVAGDHARQIGDHDRAADHLAEALTLTAPRRLAPTHAEALTVRAHLAADQHTTGETRYLHEGRDAADAALRLATGPHPLPWHQLAALYAHTHLDHAEHTDHGWAAKAAQVQHRLIPSDLDPDPLTTIENQVQRGRG